MNDCHVSGHYGMLYLENSNEIPNSDCKLLCLLSAGKQLMSSDRLVCKF